MTATVLALLLTLAPSCQVRLSCCSAEASCDPGGTCICIGWCWGGNGYCGCQCGGAVSRTTPRQWPPEAAAVIVVTSADTTVGDVLAFRGDDLGYWSSYVQQAIALGARPEAPFPVGSWWMTPGQLAEVR